MTNYSVFGQVLPAGTSTANAGVRTDGIQFTVTSACQLLGYWYYLPASSTLTGSSYTGNLWTTANGTSGSLVSGSTQAGSGTWTAGAWNFITLGTPVNLSPGSTYVAGVSSVDNLQFIHNYWQPGNPGAGGVVSGPVVVPDAASAVGGNQQTFVTAASTFPGNVSSDSWYGVDIEVQVSAVTVPGSAALSAPGHLAAAGAVTCRGAAALQAAPSLSGTAVLARSGQASLAAAPALSATAFLTRRAASPLTAAAHLAVVAVTGKRGTAPLAAAPGLSAQGSVTRPGGAHLAAAALLAASASVRAPVVAGSALLSAVATLTAAPEPATEALWRAYLAAEQAASAKWANWRMMRQAGGTDGTAGFLFGEAYEAQAVADQGYETWRLAQQQAFPGRRG